MKRRQLLKGFLGVIGLAPVAACARLVPCEKVVPVIDKPAPYGLERIVSDEPATPIGNISASTNPWWNDRSHEVDILHEDLIEKMNAAWDKCARAGSRPDKYAQSLVDHTGRRDEFGNPSKDLVKRLESAWKAHARAGGKPDRIILGSKLKLEENKEPMSYRGVPIIWDDEKPSNRIILM